MIQFTDEQNLIIDTIECNNVIVNSVPGSGKTTTILGILNKYKNERILVLVYNSRLKTETRNKNTNPNADIHTYHSLGYSINKKVTNDITLSELLVTKFHKKYNYKYIIIDEIQDMTNLYFEIVNFVLENNETEYSICVIGDQNQCIYKTKYSDERYLTKAHKIYSDNGKKWVKLQLSISFRLTNEIADLVNKIVGSNIIKTNKSGSKPVLIIEKDAYSKEFEKRFTLLINSYIIMGYDYEDIFILFPSIQSVSGNEILANRIENILVKNKINVYVPGDESYSEKLSKNKIAISTYHRVKGLERKIVIMPGFDTSYFKYYAREEDENMLDNAQYVGLTRAMEKLILIQFDEPLKFMDTIKLKELCNVISYTNDITQDQKNEKLTNKLKIILDVLTSHLNMIDIDDPKSRIELYFDSELYFGYLQEYINFYLTLTNKSEIKFDEKDLNFIKNLFQENLTDKVKLMLQILSNYILKVTSYKTMLSEINSFVNGKPIIEDNGTYGIANYLRHINQDLLLQCYGIISPDIKYINNSSDYLTIPYTSKQESNDKKTEEIVSDLAGIAIPALYQFETIGQTYITKKTSDIDNNDKVRSIFKLSARYNSKISGYIHKNDQLTNFDWVCSINISEYMKRLSFEIGKNAEFEHEMRINEFGSQFIGSIDCIDNKKIYELKCVKNLKIEHYIQLALYKYMYLKINLEPIQNKFNNVFVKEYNIKSDVSTEPKILEITDTKIILHDSTVVYFSDIMSNSTEELSNIIKELQDLFTYKFVLFNISTNEKIEICSRFDKLKEMFEYLHKNRRNKLIINDSIFVNYSKILRELGKYPSHKFKLSPKYKNHTVFLDIETTANKKIIQLGYIIDDENGTELEKGEIIYNDGYYELDYYRKVTLEQKSKGYPEYLGIIKIYELLLCSKKIIGHNILKFDSLILSHYFSKYNLPLVNFNYEDTMIMGTEYTKLKNKKGYSKYPKLEELYEHFFHNKLDSNLLHSALYDIEITKQCYYKLINL